MTAVFSKTVTEADVSAFAGVSGDTNPMHIDAEYAKRSRFGSRIAHGMLTASLLSTVIGTRLPGPGCIYVSQSLRFRRPVRIGDTVIARVTVTEMDDAKRCAVLSTVCTVAGEAVIDGQAIVLVPSRDAVVAAE
jgi:3-hydroxybutyryl-CoA dehydratase